MMLKAENFKQVKIPESTWTLWGIPVLMVIGSILHFVYDWSGKSIIIGLIAPVSESVWEHLKMTFLPLVIWWIIGYFIQKRSNEISASKWFLACLISVLVCPLIIITFFYTYTGALGIESLALDIFSMVLGLTLGQLLALHFIKYSEPGKHWLYTSAAILVLLAALFTVFTFTPPHIPLFMVS